MRYIDIFNGDADGILSLIQWRKAHPLGTNDTQILVTGVKRDIALVQQVTEPLATDAIITTLDVSFDKNSKAVKNVLDSCQSFFYCDHHKADSLFQHSKLSALIDTSPKVCTGLLINSKLDNAYINWAIAAAYGDGLDSIANDYADKVGLPNDMRQQLKELGVLVNYNGYGSSIEDLYYDPASLYTKLYQYDTAFEVIEDTESPFYKLKKGYEADIELAKQSNELQVEGVIAVVLDNAAWARRISGTYGNQLAAANPAQPVVIVTTNAQGSYTISLRAPKNHPYGASSICSQFPTGGGREGAAGVNELPKSQLEHFLVTTVAHYKNN